MRVQYTALMADARGKLAGTVASKNKGGNYLRTKAIPINPKTTYQSIQRGLLSDLSKAYQTTLTPAQQAAWTNYGRSTNAKNVFGSALILSGIAAFIKVNQIITTVGGTIITEPPVNQFVPSLASASLVANHTGPLLTLTFTPEPLTGTQGLYVWATPLLSAGISNFNSQLRFINYTQPLAGVDELHAAWIARFGTFPTVAGGGIGMKVSVVDTATGAISPFWQLSTVVI